MKRADIIRRGPMLITFAGISELITIITNDWFIIHIIIHIIIALLGHFFHLCKICILEAHTLIIRFINIKLGYFAENSV